VIGSLTKALGGYIATDGAGIDRLIRLGIGVEDADDLIACLNWALHHEASVTPAELDAWRAARALDLELR
jgi:hypothetical protein